MNNQLQVFSKEWFANPKIQSKLLWLLNHSRYFRLDMGIQNNDLPFSEKIVRIEPNSFSWRVGENKVMTDFRTHDKFAKRLYYGFYPIWDLAHKFDMSVANKWVPAANLGFDTLTAYPQASGGGSNVTTDGYALQFYSNAGAQSWATIKAAAGNDFDYTSSNAFPIYAKATNGGPANTYTQLNRSIYTFNTAALTSSASISSSVFSIYGTDRSNALFSPTLNAYSASPAANNIIAAGDYDSFGTTAYSDSGIAYASWSTAGYNNLTFNATGIGAISKTGVSIVGVREQTYDAGSSTPTFTGNAVAYLDGYFADFTGTTSDPKLVVTYSLPATANFFMFM